MQAIYAHLRRYFLIYLGLVIYLLFFISVVNTSWFDLFFSGAALHVGAKGIDFFQLPKGAWAFWHGGGLNGTLPSGVTSYAPQEFSNGNVYHPFFSLVLGSFLMAFDPERSPYIWLWVKLFVSLIVIIYFVWSFHDSKYVGFGVFLLCANFSIYLELAAWQFQFILNIFLLLLLIELSKRRSPYWSGILYWLGMLVKPVGLLFAPALLFKGRWKMMVLGIGLFIASTIAFVLTGAGKYYTDNLMMTLSSSGALGPNQIITLSALLRYTTHWPDFVYQFLQNGILLLFLFLGILKRTHIAKAVFLLIVYYLLFYEGVYEYQWSTLAYVLAICVVTCPEFQNKWVLFCMLLTCLPDCFALLNFLHIDIKNEGYLGLVPGATAWEWMVVSKLVPLGILLISVLVPDVKPVYRLIKALWRSLREVNKQLEMFGG